MTIHEVTQHDSSVKAAGFNVVLHALADWANEAEFHRQRSESRVERGPLALYALSCIFSIQVCRLQMHMYSKAAHNADVHAKIWAKVQFN